MSSRGGAFACAGLELGAESEGEVAGCRPGVGVHTVGSLWLASSAHTVSPTCSQGAL